MSSTGACYLFIFYHNILNSPPSCVQWVLKLPVSKFKNMLWSTALQQLFYSKQSQCLVYKCPITPCFILMWHIIKCSTVQSWWWPTGRRYPCWLLDKFCTVLIIGTILPANSLGLYTADDYINNLQIKTYNKQIFPIMLY